MTKFKSSRWDDNVLSMEQFPPDDILESLYKERRRVSEELKMVLELYNLEIHQRVKTMAKRSVEQDLRTRNFEARNGKLNQTCWSRIRGTNVVFSKDREIVGSGKP